MIEALLITLACVVGWMVAAAIAVPAVLVFRYGSVDFRSDADLSDEVHGKSSYCRCWTDARGKQRDYIDTIFSPRATAIGAGLLAPLVFLLLPLIPLAFPVVGTIRLLRWERDLLNHRLTLRRKVRAALEADKDQFEKCLTEARKELEKAA